jgi:hypothetical protein
MTPEDVVTAAGQQMISRQALDRGTRDRVGRHGRLVLPPGVQQGLDAAQPGHHRVGQRRDLYGLHRRHPDAAELYPEILGAVSGLEAALLNFAQDDRLRHHAQSSVALAELAADSTLSFVYSGDGAVRAVLPTGGRSSTTTSPRTSTRTKSTVSSNELRLWEEGTAPSLHRRGAAERRLARSSECFKSYFA